MEKILEDVIRKIKEKLKEKKMTQKDFSILMGKNENWFTVLPHVQGDIKVKDLLKACKILEVEPSYLLSDNFSHNICEMSMEDLIKMLVKKECEKYMEEKMGKISKLLTHIREDDNI